LIWIKQRVFAIRFHTCIAGQGRNFVMQTTMKMILALLVRSRLKRSRLFMLNIAIGGARQVGRCRVGIAHPTEVTVVAGTPGTDADPVGRYRVEDARPTDTVVARTGVGAGATTGVVAGVLAGVVAVLVDAHPVGRDRVETARPIDMEGDAGHELTC
jgi:hypothetical protein